MISNKKSNKFYSQKLNNIQNLYQEWSLINKFLFSQEANSDK